MTSPGRTSSTPRAGSIAHFSIFPRHSVPPRSPYQTHDFCTESLDLHITFSPEMERKRLQDKERDARMSVAPTILPDMLEVFRFLE